jgi:hypothetical protein
LGKGCNILFMRNQYHGIAGSMNDIEYFHYFVRGFGVKVPGGFIC